MDKQKVKELFERYHNDNYNPASEHYRFEHFWDALQDHMQSQPAIGSGAEAVSDDAMTLCDRLYKAGYVARQKERDYDPRGHQDWQRCYDAIQLHQPPTAQDSKVPEEFLELLLEVLRAHRRTYPSCTVHPQNYIKSVANAVQQFWIDEDGDCDRDPVAMLSAAPSIAEKELSNEH